jgi:hypothetical protein
LHNCKLQIKVNKSATKLYDEFETTYQPEVDKDTGVLAGLRQV